jgi:regulator of protease activity HflC (stomatin/prohibitin superfamily)
MADDDDKSSPPKPPTQREVQRGLEKQVAQMRREIAKINQELAERAEEVVEDAAGWWDGAHARASGATQALRSQAQSVSEIVRGNPGTMSSAMLLGGIFGFALGWLASQANSDAGRRWY